MYRVLISLLSLFLMTCSAAAREENHLSAAKFAGENEGNIVDVVSSPLTEGISQRRLASGNRWNRRWDSSATPNWRNRNGIGNRTRMSMREKESPARSKSDHDSTDMKYPLQPTVHAGYVFISGVYLSPPYTLLVNDDVLTVNDQPVMLPSLGGDPRERQIDSAAKVWSNRLAEELLQGSVVLASGTGESDAAITFLPRFEEGYEFLMQISGATTPTVNAIDVPEYLRPFEQYSPPEELANRLEADLVSIESVRRMSYRKVDHVPSAGTWAYPVTAFAMLLAAVAIGQLCVSRSLLVQGDEQPAMEIWNPMNRCLMLIVGLSLLDLTCTLLALQSGVMHELNPLAGHLLGSPFALVAFKIGVTLCGAGLLFALRSHFSARRAAWWLCLVCVLVTVRWVAFNSLFVT